jgi:hypothetical protein
MFDKTKEKITTKVIKPVRDAANMAIMALVVAFMALFVAISRAF